jgi:hypothetical protein
MTLEKGKASEHVAPLRETLTPHLIIRFESTKLGKVKGHILYL